MLGIGGVDKLAIAETQRWGNGTGQGDNLQRNANSSGDELLPPPNDVPSVIVGQRKGGDDIVITPLLLLHQPCWAFVDKRQWH